MEALASAGPAFSTDALGSGTALTVIIELDASLAPYHASGPEYLTMTSARQSCATGPTGPGRRASRRGLQRHNHRPPGAVR